MDLLSDMLLSTSHLGPHQDPHKVVFSLNLICDRDRGANTPLSDLIIYFSVDASENVTIRRIENFPQRGTFLTSPSNDPEHPRTLVSDLFCRANFEID